MCLERLCLFASSFPEHLYVFVVLMNGTKVSGGPAKGGRGGRGGVVRENSQSEAEAGGRPLSGQLP